MTVRASGEDIGSLQPELPKLSDFDVIGTNRSSSTQISIVDGKMRSTNTVDFLYYLRPKQPGMFTIGAVKVKHKGREYRTKSIRIEVAKGPTGTARTAPGARPGAGQETVSIADNLYVRAMVNKQNAYVGEQITVTYKLYNRLQLSNVEYGKRPSHSGFWVESLFDAQRLDWRQEVVDGKTYNVAILKKTALFPTTSGSHTFDPLELRCDVVARSRRRSFFDFDRTQNVTISTDPVRIEVAPLPKAGSPPDFDGAVGQFGISSTAQPLTVKQGDPVSLKVRVSGLGNLEAVTKLSTPALAGFKLYEPKISKTDQRKGDVIGGVKTFEYVLIPKMPGREEIPSFSFSYFDPTGRKYRTARTQPISLVVTPGEQPQEVASAGYALSREEVKLVGSDIRYIKPDLDVLIDHGERLHRNGLFLSLQCLPLLAFAGALAYRRHLLRIRSDVAYVRRRRAKGEAVKRLRAAGDALKDGRSKEFHAEVYRVLTEFLGDRLNVSAAGMTGEAAVEHLRQQNLETDLLTDVEEIFRICDFARFAPSSLSSEDMSGLYERAKDLLSRLEKVL